MEIQLSQAASANPEIRIGKLSKPQRTTDTVTALLHMQKMIGAKNFAVFRIRGQGLPSARRLACALSNWADQAEHQACSLLEEYGAGLITHLEASTLPVVWEGAETDRGQAAEIPLFTERFTSQRYPVSGIAFPVRLGSGGNGFVVFTGDLLDLGDDVVLDMHMRATQVMIELLGADEKRMLPAEALNDREIACLQMAGDGCISETIAEKMGLSVHTVNAYLGTATAKLDAVNRIQAIAKAIRLGYIR
ncbi:helix-turn-helix transcriptional regulator [Rhizobium sp. ARZ01]|uniref:transcriptional regulator VisR n=1 Tax=Rhizobium sp. ARZ01 TaxID=2769313 RepID=UPI00177B3656|nr:LuxR C-terminal-related transcriptional regulator [Rhizobium sp. ARZ01]MBD9373878.1 helix-turn-helix transcriptional regulator [Rhizobium sp. ARZ01]